MKIDNTNEEIVNSIQIPTSYLSIRRIIEIILIISIMPIFIILLIITTLLVFFDAGPNIHFVQDRAGLMGKKFKLYKFRTMKTHTSRKFREGEISSLGHFLRKHRLDELPQIINILKGDMSLIGPRPEPYIYHLDCKREIPFYCSRNIIRPGLTGWAQVKFRHTSDMDGAQEKLKYDLYYLTHLGYKIDLHIFFNTFRVLFTGSGAK
jgi:lipopolysaccharide/colanic/teichoic acid biosynthesis glycosyltransferase